MDQIKIGRYIAEKRKAMGLTQVELAEKLGMSNKSVSKWERGVCLPDVSVYMDLCEALGISLNEFLAGEDIEPANIAKKSEETIINVAKDGNQRSRKFKAIAMSLITVVLILLIALFSFMVKDGFFINNYLENYDYESDTYGAVSALLPSSGAFVYRFSIKDDFREAVYRIYEYDHGTLKEKPIGEMSVPLYFDADGEHGTFFKGKGYLGIIYDDCRLTLTCPGEAYNNSSYKLDLEDIITDVHEQPGIGLVPFNGMTRIKSGKEIPLLTIGYGNNGACMIPPEDFPDDPNGFIENSYNNYDIIITITFN